MNPVKPQTLFLILCIFLFIQTPITFGMDIESTENNLSPHDRKLATLTSCFSQNCKQSGSLTDEDSSYDYSITLGISARIRFEFIIGQEETEISISLSATPSAGINTNFVLNPSNSYISPITSANWNRDLTFDSSDSNRRLIIDIENDSASQSSVRFRVKVEDISSSHTWMAPVISVVVVGAVIFLVICICCRIRRNIRNRRRRRAQAAYEVALANAQAEANEDQQPINAQAQQHQHHAVQINHVPAPSNQNIRLAPSIEMMSKDQNNPNNGPLNKDNFEKRFPERAGRMLKSSFPQKTCSICLEDLGKLEKCRQLYCEHIFHSECVKLWLLNQMEKQNNCFCPNCNKKVTYAIEKAKQDV